MLPQGPGLQHPLGPGLLHPLGPGLLSHPPSALGGMELGRGQLYNPGRLLGRGRGGCHRLGAEGDNLGDN